MVLIQFTQFKTMRTPSLLLLLVFISGAAATHHHRHRRHHGHKLGREKATNLHFYLHDTLSGKDPTAVLVAHGAAFPPRPGVDPTPFSSVYAVDDALTEGPERASRAVGNAQGLYVVSGKTTLSLVMALDFEITAGRHGNSSFSVFSRNPVMAGDGRELAVVGGRGKFRMARGFALLRTHYLNPRNGDAVLEYNVTLLHY